jgi:hypothetical protein
VGFDRGSRPQAGIGRDRGLSLIAIIFEFFDSSFFLRSAFLLFFFSMADQSSSAQVVYPKLNGKNYASWAFAMQIDMFGRELLAYTDDGSLVVPSKSDPEYATKLATWKKRELSCLVLSWII